MYFKDKVIYQIYPKSFYDSDNDGYGNLKGVTEKLDYFTFLGVDYIWLSPFCVSPQNDNGYDTEDYLNIDPMYGTMEDFEELVKEANKRNIQIMMDLVLNHTSTQHEWFQKALQGDKKYQKYYFFEKSNKNGTLPTNWVSYFGGDVWEYAKELDMYYLHIFDKTQADLNWDNPEVREEVANIVQYWIDKGVTGFRLDVINLISKTLPFRNDYEGVGKKYYADGPNVHKYLKELKKKTFGKANILTVGEMCSTAMEHCFKYAGEKEEELAMVFNFHHLKVDYKNGNKWSLMPFDFQKLKDLLFNWQLGMQDHQAWNALFLNNHDQPRAVSRYGNDTRYWNESAKMLATAIQLLQGTPYIYQGEEIGMTNAYFTNIEQYRDVESTNYYQILKDKGIPEKEVYKILQERSRDNSRTPMQWNSKENAGFTKGKPWIEVNKNYTNINVENSMKDKESILYHYRRLIQLRKQYPIFNEGEILPLAREDKQIFAYKRRLDEQEAIIINNFYGSTTTFTLDRHEKYQCILTNYNDTKIDNIMHLRPYESIVLITIKEAKE
ncbi:MAG: alpha,alpha-phosphotrehalase [Coprobacillaceae bacterium]